MSVEAFVPDERGWLSVRTLADELSGDLQPVQQDPGLFLVDAGIAESVAHLLHGEPDALRSFDVGELQTIVGVFGAIESYMKFLMVKAISHTA